MQVKHKDIIITDPCYILKQPSDWDLCKCGENMEALGFTNFLSQETGIGDWGNCITNIDTKERIGSFCADSGSVAVFELDEVLAYNPEFNDHITKPWTTTLIKDFNGEITISYITSGKDSLIRWAVVKSTGNINFTSVEDDDED